MPRVFTPDATTRRRISKFFPVLVTGRARNHLQIKDFERILPPSMIRRNKLEILNGGDRIQCSDTDSKEPLAGERDNSFVRVSSTSFL